MDPALSSNREISQLSNPQLERMSEVHLLKTIHVIHPRLDQAMVVVVVRGGGGGGGEVKAGSVGYSP